MKLIWTRLALEDLKHAHDYIASENPTAASYITQRIEKALLSLCLYPELGRHGRVEGTRELIISGTPFIVPYRTKKNRIELLAIIHGSRRWPDTF
ncbi:MAG: type II toxin-antitoxin system RelE/ParE family toxin [Elusimicrobia bacterium]|nr:type II toxin-antitoxin system RelE/ParE family toxin [Elusimicrobiota bacterium]